MAPLLEQLKNFFKGLVKDDGSSIIPMNLVAWLFVIFACFIAGGGIYILFEEQFSYYYVQGRWVSIMPYSDAQTILEGMGYMILSFFMFIGLYLSYTSTKVKYDSKKAQTYLLLGAILLLVGIFGSQYLIGLKTGLITG